MRELVRQLEGAPSSVKAATLGKGDSVATKKDDIDMSNDTGDDEDDAEMQIRGEKRRPDSSMAEIDPQSTKELWYPLTNRVNR